MSKARRVRKLLRAASNRFWYCRPARRGRRAENFALTLESIRKMKAICKRYVPSSPPQGVWMSLSLFKTVLHNAEDGEELTAEQERRLAAGEVIEHIGQHIHMDGNGMLAVGSKNWVDATRKVGV